MLSKLTQKGTDERKSRIGKARFELRHFISSSDAKTVTFELVPERDSGVLKGKLTISLPSAGIQKPSSWKIEISGEDSSVKDLPSAKSLLSETVLELVEALKEASSKEGVPFSF